MDQTAEEQFLDAFDAYADGIYRHCFFRVHRQDIAQELTQETFTKTWMYLAEHGSLEHIRAFLYRVATNLVIDHCRKKKPDVSIDVMTEVGCEPGEDPQQDLNKGMDDELFLRRLDDLEDEERNILIMRYAQDLKPKEIAQLLGISANYVSVKLTRAKKNAAKLFV